MNKHTFNLRLTATYASSENQLDTLVVTVLGEDGWEPLELNTMTPGFLIYVYAMFTCQHLYLRTNGTERGLAFASSKGHILVETSAEWLLEKVDVDFQVNLAAGEASSDDVDYIISRMQRCPVSKNLPAGIAVQTAVEFNHDR
jgi:hypothetical protein